MMGGQNKRGEGVEDVFRFKEYRVNTKSVNISNE